MSDAQAPAGSAPPSGNQTLSILLRILAGPAAFALVRLVPFEGLDTAGHVGLACFAWVVAWWATRPVPWAVAGLLPLLLFPLLSVMPFRDAAALYGQRVFPFLVGVMLFGHAFRKHGLAKRFAFGILSLPGVAASGPRLVLMMMVVTAALSALIDDAAAVAIMIPIALSVTRFVNDAGAADGASVPRTPRLQTATCLAVLYGSAAGGMATPVGVPFNPLAISLLDQLTPYRISFAQWTMTGVLLAVAVVPVYYTVLRFMSAPEVSRVAGGAAFFAARRRGLGALAPGERNVLAVLVIMVALWLAPSVAPVTVLDLWVVPTIGMVLLFLLPIRWKTRKMTLEAGDFQDGVLWNVVFLVVGGTAMAGALTQLGVAEWLGGRIEGGVSASALPWFAGLVTPALSHLTSGTATTAMVSTVLYPVADNLGYNPAILARIIAGTALAVSLPWAGAASSTAFASGAISFGDMFRIGVVATVLTMVVITVLSMILVPALGAYSTP